MAAKSLSATGVYDRINAWQVKIARSDAAGRLHRINKTFPYDPAARPSHPHSRTSRFHEAAAFASAERSALRVERRALPETRQAQTLAAWLDRYETEETPKKKSAVGERSTLSRLREMFRDLLARPVLDLKPGDFVGHDARSVQGRMESIYAPATIRRYLTVLSHVFTVARSRWDFEGAHPSRGTTKPSSHDERTRVVSADEWTAIDASWLQSLPTTVAALRWLRWTAARRGAAIKLDWSDIDWTTQPPTAHLRDTKGHHNAPAQSRHIPLLEEAVRALQPLRGKSWPAKGPVFGKTRADSLTRAWTRACKRAGVNDARVHDLRHTRITELAPTLPLQVLARLTGHKDPAMLMRYYNPTAADAAAAGRAIAAHFESSANNTTLPLKDRQRRSKRYSASNRRSPS